MQFRLPRAYSGLITTWLLAFAVSLWVPGIWDVFPPSALPFLIPLIVFMAGWRLKLGISTLDDKDFVYRADSFILGAFAGVIDVVLCIVVTACLTMLGNWLQVISGLPELIAHLPAAFGFFASIIPSIIIIGVVLQRYGPEDDE